MSPASADQNLLFGLLALQNGLIDQGQLVAVFQAWTRDKARPIADHLVARGDLDADDRIAVEALVARHLKRHGGETEKSLASIPAGQSTREKLAALGDPQIEATLQHVASGSTELGRTVTYAVGTTTSDGSRFRVLRPHARGGLGAVFVALDSELHREVALKQILDSHADDPSSRQRFLNEAEITGGLEHPGIVPVYGLGAYKDGRPFYAMRFVRGDSLKEAIERFHARPTNGTPPESRDLEIRRLLRRFLDVCNAIDYAHSRGVLHRDIKPGNIIVGKYGETLVVDWGLAKATGKSDPTAAERTLMPSPSSGSTDTLPGSALGTPAYMSPEQATGNLDLLGPQSDVYSLGATLYCLLTGKPPFSDDDIGAMLRKVQNGEFAPPRQLNPSIDKALQAVCLKAMALKPANRYATCKALADDIEHWLADEPVTARREPVLERTRRWMRRHRLAMTAASVALAAVVLGLSAFSRLQAEANRQLEAALNNQTRLTASERVALQLADTRFKLAQEAIEAFYNAVRDDTMLRDPKMKVLRDKLLGTALSFYGRWEEQIRSAKSNSEYDLYLMALQIDRSAQIQAELGLRDEALRTYQRIVELGDGKDSNSILYGLQSKTYLRIARLYRQLGQPAQAMSAFKKALARMELLARANPTQQLGDLGWVLLSLGGFQAEQGDTKSAMQSLERARDVCEEHARKRPLDYWNRQDLAETITAIGNIKVDAGHAADALIEYEKAREIHQQLVATKPENREFQADLARAFNNIGYALTDLGRPAQAVQSLDRGLQIRETLLAASPLDVGARSDLARSLYFRARLYAHRGLAEESLDDLAKAEDLFQGIVGTPVPEDLFYQACLPALRLKMLTSSEMAATAQGHDEREELAVKTIARLRVAIDAGFRNLRLLQHEEALDPLRARADFQALLMDLAMPTEPFTR